MCVTQNLLRLDQSVTNTFFLTEDEYQILFGFRNHQILNIEYYSLFFKNTNTEYYSVSRKSEYRIRIVLFGLTIRILNSKYQKI